MRRSFLSLPLHFCFSRAFETPTHTFAVVSSRISFSFCVEHPHGFYARASKNGDGSSNLMVWDCGIPGQAGTPWEGGCYKVKLTFSEDYPDKPPICSFTPRIFHPNVFPSGKICLSIIDETKGWQPTISVKQILIGVQQLLGNPNLGDPAQREPFELLRDNPAAYEERVRQEARKQPAL